MMVGTICSEMTLKMSLPLWQGPSIGSQLLTDTCAECGGQGHITPRDVFNKSSRIQSCIELFRRALQTAQLQVYAKKKTYKTPYRFIGSLITSSCRQRPLLHLQKPHAHHTSAGYVRILSSPRTIPIFLSPSLLQAPA